MHDKPYLYTNSADEARRLNELDDWRASHRANIDCAKAIDEAIRNGFDGMHLHGDIAKNMCEEYGIDRVRWVLANTIQLADWDKRYRPNNREWADTVKIFRNGSRDVTPEFSLNSHPEIVNGLVNQFREYCASLNLFDQNHCEENSADIDYTMHVLVLNPDILKDECKTPENQLFFANKGGFGCSPGSQGKVMGQFLSDGEESNFHRNDFIGVIKSDYLPEWAAQKLEDLTLPTESENSETLIMNGGLS